MTINHQDGYIRVEKHLTSDGGIEHPCEQGTAIGAQGDHVDLLITHELLYG